MKKTVAQIVNFPAQVLKPLRDYLVNEQKRLVKTKKKLEKEDPFADPSRATDNSAIDTDVAEQVNHERVSAVKSEVDKALINIRKTLTRIKVGDFGICAGCGKMIDTDRLAINPTAEFCVECERKAESKRR